MPAQRSSAGFEKSPAWSPLSWPALPSVQWLQGHGRHAGVQGSGDEHQAIAPPLYLPLLQVNKLLSDGDMHEVKFKAAGDKSSPALVANLVVVKVPAEAAVWQLHLGEPTAAQDTPTTADVRCGEPFELLVEAHDQYGNR